MRGSRRASNPPPTLIKTNSASTTRVIIEGMYERAIRFYRTVDEIRQLRSKPLPRVCLTVATLSDSTDCKVKSWITNKHSQADRNGKLSIAA
jgi:hypothetical protein